MSNMPLWMFVVACGAAFINAMLAIGLDVRAGRRRIRHRHSGCAVKATGGPPGHVAGRANQREITHAYR